MQIREANLDLTRILAYPAIPFDLTSREIATGNRAIAFRTNWIMYRKLDISALSFSELVICGNYDIQCKRNYENHNFVKRHNNT